MDISKRLFLRNLTGLTAGASLISVTELQAAPHNDNMTGEGDSNKRYGMIIDLRKCIGCQACTVSCSMENLPPIGQFRTTVQQYEVQMAETDQVSQVMLPRLCNHCANPPCVPVCPTQATYQRADGIVVVDNELVMTENQVVSPVQCFGCWTLCGPRARVDTKANLITYELQP